MTQQYTGAKKEYIEYTGITPKKTEEILTMNYCLRWCEVYGKSIADWCKKWV